jgi:hypothetical protein
MLIVLLILSPLAYLALVFPNFSHLSKAWWQSFLKYVFYGPAVLAILMVALRATDITDVSAYLDLTVPIQSLAAHALRIFILVTGLFMAAVAGRYAGIVGSAATISAVARVGAKGRGMALSGLRGARTGAVTAGLAPVRGAAGRTGAYAGGAWAAARERYPVLRKIAPTRDQLKAAGRGAVERRTGMPSPVLRARSLDEQRRGDAAVATAKRNPLQLEARDLQNKYVGAQVARNQPSAIKDLVAGAGASAIPGVTENEVRAIEVAVRTKALMGELNDKQKMEIAVELDNSKRTGRLPASDVQRIQTELLKTISSGPTGPTE